MLGEHLNAACECDFVVAETAGAELVKSSQASNHRHRHDGAHLYRECHLREFYINKIKHYRRIIARFEKPASRYTSFHSFVAANIWLR
jgi:transposase